MATLHAGRLIRARVRVEIEENKGLRDVGDMRFFDLNRDLCEHGFFGFVALCPPQGPAIGLSDPPLKLLNIEIESIAQARLEIN